MTVGIVIVTHGKSGECLVEEAEFVLGGKLSQVHFVALDQAEDDCGGETEIRSAIEVADSGEGVLVLTDLMGASPSNRVTDVLEDYHAVMVTGINLGMLIRVCNYQDEALEKVVRKAVDGGRRAVKIFQK